MIWKNAAYLPGKRLIGKKLLQSLTNYLLRCAYEMQHAHSNDDETGQGSLCSIFLIPSFLPNIYALFTVFKVCAGVKNIHAAPHSL